MCFVKLDFVNHIHVTMYLSYLKWHDMTSIQDCNPEAVLQQRRPFSTGAQEHFICELCVGRSSTTFRTVDGLLQHRPVFQSTIVYTAVMILDQMIKFVWQHQSVLRGFNSGSSCLPTDSLFVEFSSPFRNAKPT